MRAGILFCLCISCTSAPDEADPLTDGAVETASDVSIMDTSVLADASTDVDDAAEVGDVAPDTTDATEGGLLPAASVCAPTTAACAGSADVAVYASYRKDFFFPYSRYPEASIPDPVDGGRIQIAAIAKVSGKVSSLELEGVDANAALTAATLDWWHVWPTDVSAGEPVWVSFHSREKAWDAKSKAHVVVKTAAGVVVDADFPVRKALVPVTYVAANEMRSSLTVFLTNYDAKPHSLESLIVNGETVTDSACIPKKTLAPKENLRITVPLCKALPAGAAWTVVAKYSDAEPAVGVGRAVSNFFPIEYWPSSGECSVPGGGDSDKWESIRSHGLDTIFPQLDWSKCPSGITPTKWVETELLPNSFHALVGRSFHALVGRDASTYPWSYGEKANVAGVFLADEADGSYGDPANPDSGPKGLAAKSRSIWNAEPAIATYAGGSRHRHNGAFAGSTDIQGFDFYVAACAPHITDFGTHPPLRAPYDFFSAVRANHMPLPTWLYAQGQSTAWNASLLGTEIDRQPEAAEMRVQAYMTMAAGAKGLMWFQIHLGEAKKNARNQATWAEIGKVNREFRAVREFLQAGDLLGTAATSAPSTTIVEAIRSGDAIVVPVISLATDDGPTDLGCAAAQDMHWKMKSQKVDIRVAVPDDFEAFEVLEVSATSVSVVAVKIAGRTISIEGVDLDQSKPTRLYVLSSSKSVSGAIKARIESP